MNTLTRCIHDGCGREFDTSLPESRDSLTLRPFWQQYCPQHRRTPNHYVAGAGLHGCLFQYCAAHESYQDAVDDLASLHELGRTRKAQLKRDGYLKLNLRRDGNEYCEITECNCHDIESHAS